MLNPQALQTVYKQLATFAAQDNFEDSIEQIFGTKIDRVKLSILRNRWLNDDFSVIPEIEILSGGELGTANGGYAASTNKIYLSASFLSTANPTAITNLLLEETGHFIDSFINQHDTAGDEGAIFANFILGNKLTAAELNLLRAEDDRASIVLNGQQISIEQQNIPGDNDNNTLTGTSTNDLIEGFGGSDTISGLAGNDTLNGGDENDTITGGLGNDIIIFEYYQNDDLVTDFVRGQDKIDLRKLRISDWETIKALMSNDGVNNALITTYFRDVYSQLKVQGINLNLLQATDFIFNNLDVADAVNGSDYVDQLFAGLGDDSINGLYGDDTLYGEQGNDILNGGYDNDILYGGAGNDILNGSAGDDTITGGLGNDIIIFEYSQNNDTVTDFVRGQDKIDLRKLRISDWETLKALMSNDGVNNALITTYFRDVYSQLKVQGINLNLLQATDFIFNNLDVADAVNGSDYVDQLFAGLGDDSINGLYGDDTLYGEQGNDILNGGYDNDILYGGAGNDILNGNAGNDTITGGLGDDTAVYSGTRAQYQLTSNSGVFTITDLVANRDGFDTLQEVQKIKFSDQTLTIASVEPTITNHDVANQIGVSLSINDITVVEGKDANALLTVSLSSTSTQPISVNYTTTAINATANGDYTTTTGTLVIPANSSMATIRIPIVNDNLNEADESFIVTLSNPINATLDPDASIAEVTITDTLRSAITRILPANVENLTLTGAGATNGTGNAGNNIITGNIANNILTGGLGVDTLIGGAGNDTYVIDNLGDIVTETSTLTTEIDTVQSSVNYTLVLNVEQLTLTGIAAINGSGNAGNNFITGNSGANILSGAAGNDTLVGGLGVDRFLFNNKTEGIDTISDFTAGEKIVISALGFGGGLVATAINASQFLSVTTGSAATNTTQRVIYNSTTGGLYFDADGSGTGAALQFATLATKPTLMATDFVVS
jgi:Ca2+-binding RTX toxin-like protein